MTEDPLEIERRKRAMRRQAEANRRAQAGKDEASRAICRRLADLPEYAAAGTLSCYVAFRNEVRTRAFLEAAMASGKRVVVPYCHTDRLALFRLESMDELAPGTLGILEPRAELRSLSARRIEAHDLDLMVVPGVAFDRRAARLGHGKGYYDRLLVDVRPDAPIVGLAFECQLFPEVPTRPHDVALDLVITERAVYRGRGRRRPSPGA